MEQILDNKLYNISIDSSPYPYLNYSSNSKNSSYASFN